MDTEKLKQFLVKAKTNTYALGGEGSEKILEDGRKEFRFEASNYIYQDQYYGHDPFIGEEIVWENKKIIWGMNYYGRVITEDISPSLVYAFLKEALKTVNSDIPSRGDREFSDDKFTYINKVKGAIDNFTGKEGIYYEDKLVYKLTYNGGVINNKKNIE